MKVGSTEIVDNIVFNVAETGEPPDPPMTIPAPSTLWLLLGCLLLCRGIRHR